MDAQQGSGNKLLAALPANDFALLAPQLARVDLPVRKMLEWRGRKLEHVYFLETGLASAVAQSGAVEDLEVGVIGKEGMTGLCLVHEVNRSPNDVFIQIAGSGWRIEEDKFRNTLAGRPAMRSIFLKYAHTMLMQMSFSALAAGRQNTDRRLARWLLMALDRIEGPRVDLTHEFLAIMLGTRRAGVTVALKALVLAGAIETLRGHILIKNRHRLEELADGGYGEPEAEYRRLFQGGN